MHTRILGKDLEVSAVGLGCDAFYALQTVFSSFRTE